MPGVQLPDYVSTFGEVFAKFPDALDTYGDRPAHERLLSYYAQEYAKLPPSEFLDCPCVVRRVRWIGGTVETSACAQTTNAERRAGGYPAEGPPEGLTAGVALFRFHLPADAAYFDDVDRAACDARYVETCASIGLARAAHE